MPIVDASSQQNIAELAPKPQQLSKQVEEIVRTYFSTLDGEPVTNLYEIIMKEVERPLIQVVLEESKGNKSKCADILGLNRGTLRKKLSYLNLD